jgi:hypothetical protein
MVKKFHKYKAPGMFKLNIKKRNYNKFFYFFHYFLNKKTSVDL